MWWGWIMPLPLVPLLPPFLLPWLSQRMITVGEKNVGRKKFSPHILQHGRHQGVGREDMGIRGMCMCALKRRRRYVGAASVAWPQNITAFLHWESNVEPSFSSEWLRGNIMNLLTCRLFLLQVCRDQRCVNASFYQLDKCVSKCHGHGVSSCCHVGRCHIGWLLLLVPNLLRDGSRKCEPSKKFIVFSCQLILGHGALLWAGA